MITITSRKAKKKMVTVRGKSVPDMKSPEFECSDVVVLDVDGKKTDFPCRDILVGFATAVNHLIINKRALVEKLGKPKAAPVKDTPPAPKPKKKGK